MQLHSVGDFPNSLLSGSVAFVDSVIHDDLNVIPLLSTVPPQSSCMESLASLLPVLAPSAQGTLDLGVSSRQPIRVGSLPLAGEINLDLRLRGSLKAPVPTGRLTLSNLQARLPSGRLLLQKGTMDFIADEPWNPLLLAIASGWVGQHFVEAVAFGGMNDGRWVLRSPDSSLTSQDLTLLLEQGAQPLEIASETIPPLSLASNFRPYIMQSTMDKFPDLSGDNVFFTSLQHPRAQWGNERPFSETLDFDPDSTVLPLKAYDSGFEWKFR
jgi:hypothetical protein